MSGDLTNLIFGKPLEVSQLFGPSEKSHFGGFMDQYVPAEDARGRRMYVHCTKGYSVWERPETILGLLLANKYIPRTLSVERWVSIPKSPLIIIDCGDGYLLLANKINGRVKLDVDEPIWGMIGHEAEKALKGPAYQKDSQKSYSKVPTIMEVLENLQLKASRTEEEKQDPTSVSIVQKNAFFDVLRENSVPVLGDYQRIFENLASSSRDVRLHAVPTILMQSLLEEYVTNQKKSLEEQAKNQREKLLDQYRALCEAWFKQYLSSPKFKANFGLFKEKHRQDKVYKEAIKYFDLEKLFKEICENRKPGSISAAVKSSIEAFIDLLIDIKRKVNMKGEPSPMLLLAPEVKAFSALSEEDKRKVFEEFKDKLN